MSNVVKIGPMTSKVLGTWTMTFHFTFSDNDIETVKYRVERQHEEVIELYER
jgi:hypothetical protein